VPTPCKYRAFFVHSGFAGKCSHAIVGTHFPIRTREGAEPATLVGEPATLVGERHQATKNLWQKKEKILLEARAVCSCNGRRPGKQRFPWGRSLNFVNLGEARIYFVNKVLPRAASASNSATLVPSVGDALDRTLMISPYGPGDWPESLSQKGAKSNAAGIYGSLALRKPKNDEVDCKAMRVIVQFLRDRQ